MNRSAAEVLLLDRLAQRAVGEELGGVAILSAVEKAYGWVLVYNSRRYFETGDPLAMLVGAGPVVVVSATHEVHELGSARAPDEALRALEERLGLTP